MKITNEFPPSDPLPEFMLRVHFKMVEILMKLDFIYKKVVFTIEILCEQIVKYLLIILVLDENY